MNFFQNRFELVLGVGALGLSTLACGNTVVGSGGSTASSSSTAVSASATSGTASATTSSTSVSTTATTGTGAVCTTADGVALAINQLYLGDKNPDGSTTGSPWKQYGLNIDGQNTTNDFTMHCTANSGAAPANVFPNGNGGIDNSFGHNIVPLLTAVSPTFSDTINMNIAAGTSGYLFDLVGLASGASQTGFATRFYAGDPLGHPAKFDGTDCWPVDAATLNVPTDFTSAKSTFTMGTLAANVWTTGAPQTLNLTVDIQGYALGLTLHHAVVTATLDANHQGATGGEISGVLGTEELVSAVKQLAGSLDPTLCSGTTLAGIESQIRQASDIMVDGTQNPAMMCNGISMGLGFTAKSIQLSAIGPASPPPAMPCP